MLEGTSVVGFGYNRKDKDFYPTAEWVTEALFRHVKFKGTVWECASGNGDMSRVIEKYNRCISSDLRTDDAVYGKKGIDFLNKKKKFSNVITNPPFKLAEEFVWHALKCSKKKVAILCKLSFLEGQKRYKLFTKTPLRKILVFSRRPSFTDEPNKGLLAYAWFVWQHGYEGNPHIEWIDPSFSSKNVK